MKIKIHLHLHLHYIAKALNNDIIQYKSINLAEI